MSVRVILWSLFALLILFLSHQTFPQTYIPEKIQFKHITSEYGLVDKFIWCLLQDNKGFLWIGTSNGLVRYDGLKFKRFINDTNDPKSLGGNSVRVLFEDINGTLWVGTSGGGLNRYNPLTENFTRFTNIPSDSNSISSNYVLAIYEDKSGNLLIGTEGGGLNLLDGKSGKFSKFKNLAGDPASISSNKVTCIFEDSKGKIWVGTIGGGLNLFDKETKKFTRFINKPDDITSISHNSITGIFEDGSGNLWVVTLGGGINKLSFNKNNQPYFSKIRYNPNKPGTLSDDDIFSVHLDKNQYLWVGTWGGGLNKTKLPITEDSSLTFITYTHDPFDFGSLGNDNISFIYQDKSEVLWIATWGGGLHSFSNLSQKFKHYKHNPSDLQSLSSNGIMSIFEDKAGAIWIGTWSGGLNKWDRATDKFKHYKFSSNNSNGLNDNTISAIYEDRYGILWLGTWNGGLNKFDRKTEKFYHYKNNQLDPKSISDDRIMVITEDQLSNLWIGTYYGGLNKFDRQNGNFTSYRTDSDNPNSISSDHVAALLADDSGILWIGSKLGGLDMLDLHTGIFSHYNHDPGNPNSLSNDKVTSIYKDTSGILWIGTAEGGLNKFNKNTGLYQHYQSKDGLAGNYVMGILQDSEGNLWISTDAGLSKFNPKTEIFRNYYAEDGLQGNEFEEFLACRKLRSGELLFGGPDGFNIFKPANLKDNLHIPPVFITGFYLFNKPIGIGFDSLHRKTIISQSIIESKELELNYDDNVFSFEFAALDYQAPNKNKYAYIMEGFDKIWTYTDARRNLATYTNLDPGEYIFRVKGSNNDGVWNEEGASIKIIILPPWWRTNLAYIIYFLLIGSIIYFTWKAQLRRIRIKNEYEMSKFEAKKLHEVDEIKSRFFTNISHEFRTPLTLILGPSKELSNESNDEKTKTKAELIHRSASKLNRLVDELLDISKIEAGEMKLKACPVNIVALVSELTFSFHSLSERKKITFNFHCDENEIITYLDKDKTDKILTNVLSNAFKFTPEGGKVEIEMLKDESQVQVIVSDTGMGIPKDKIEKIFDRFYQVDGGHTREYEGTGIGLALTKELVDLHKGKIEVESQEGKGSTFRLIFPLGKNHLKPEEICEEEKEKENLIPEPDEFLESKVEHKAGVEFSDKPTLLIVEDNPDVRNYISLILENLYRIFEAKDGEEGLNKSFECIPDLIISDVMMPKLDGFQMCIKLKTDSRTSHIPIIMLTAKATINDKINGLEIGADDYIMKPFEAGELKARIKNLLAQRKRLHEHFRKYGLVEIEEKNITPVDQKFLQKALAVINEHISDTSFGVEVLANDMAVSRSLLLKKINALVGEPPSELIKRTRLDKAAKLIGNNSHNISEIAIEVGFSNPSYFAECFRKQFGVAPSQYHQSK